MDLSNPFYAYKETRLDLDPATQGSTIAIRLPLPGASTQSLRTLQKRSHITDIPIAEDEKSFRQRHLASAASVYHRTFHKSPRSFLWRVLEDGKVLSIRVVDVSCPKTTADTNLTLRFTFPSAIKSGGIALADSKEHDVLSVFVLVDSKQLYTLTLRPEYFRRASSTEDNVLDWCKIYSSPALGFKQFHRLVALDTNQLLVSLHDGSLLKLNKVAADGSEWKEIHFNEGGWSNFRNLIPFQSGNTIKYENRNLELSVATSIASPGLQIGGKLYAFTASIDHRLRIWNLSTGKVAYLSDLVGEVESTPQEQEKKILDPSQSQYVKTFDYGNGIVLCVTYSPIVDTGRLKFWSVSLDESGNLKLTDLFEGMQLIPALPSSDQWTMADFGVVVDRMNTTKLGLWILWKSGETYRLHKLDIQCGASPSDVEATWASGWKAMATETLRQPALPSVFPGDPSDGTEKWLELILAPGRFTTNTIETALAIWERSNGKGSTRKTDSLPERICGIASKMSLNRASDASLDFDQFRAATDAQWRKFYRLLTELTKKRGEAMSLVIDPQGAMPWVVLAEGITAIRDCSTLEMIWHNDGRDHSEMPPGSQHLSNLVFAASGFRDSFSEQLLHSCRATILEEVFQEPSLTAPARMRAFYEKCDFSNQIGDDDFTQLVSGLGGDFKNVTEPVYGALLDSIVPLGKLGPLGLPLAEFGNKLVVKGIQETVDLHRNILLDQMVLLVLIENEINHGEEGTQFETGVVFDRIIFILKRLEIVNWLASTEISMLPQFLERSNSTPEKSSALTKKSTPKIKTITVLEAVLSHLWSLNPQQGETLGQVITETLIHTCGPETQDFGFEIKPSSIQCLLLRNERPDLAVDFSRFALRDAFSVYIQGRAYLANNDADAAAALFKQAAFGLGWPKPRLDRPETNGYLSSIELKLLNAGLPQYYSHIMSLFEEEKVYSYVIDFARLALQFIRSGPSPTPTKDLQELRTDLHSRLFNAAIQTSRWEIAHSDLVLFTNTALQLASLRTLITKMCESSHATEMISLPFIGLQDNVDEILAQKCQGIIDVTLGAPYHKILYSWRIKRNDFRGAAAISYERLERLKQSGEGDKLLGDDGLETPVTRQYMTLINALSCVNPKQAWILSEELPQKGSVGGFGKSGGSGGGPKRKVVTLEEVRRGYQEELDRIAAIQNNQFAFGQGDAMEIM